MDFSLLTKKLFKIKEVAAIVQNLHDILSNDEDFNTALKHSSRLELNSNIKKLAKLKGIDIYKLNLYVAAVLAHKAYFKYLQKGISKTIFFDTMADIEIWCCNYHSQTGSYGLKAFDWIYSITGLKVFKLGALQFELVSLQKSYDTGIKRYEKGDILINVHIRQNVSLEQENCADSYKRAILFFKGVKEVFICNSWLLNPVLRELLSEESNIIRFQSDYSIVETDDESKMAEERIFGFKKDPLSYPQNTSLQKKAKQYLLSGNKIGCSIGIYDLS